jgi:hypothetical protein
MRSQPWIGQPVQDVLFILLPPFLSLALIALFPQFFQNNRNMPDAGWVILILLVDVAHVYSTLYRTYFDPQALSKQRSLLWSIPFFSFAAGVLLYSLGSLLFWRVLAYVAVFHFVRQQYGFMRVYSRREPKGSWATRIDTLTIYTVTLYPLLYWHLRGPRNFNWFVEDDFVFLKAAFLLPVLSVGYWLIVAVYVGKEIFLCSKTKQCNLPKLAVISGTLLSWYFGIVYFNGDMAFTLLNVVSHGIPYMALIWLYGEKQYRKKERGYAFLKLVFSRWGVLLFLGLIFLFAFVEEGLWDLTLWKEHKNIFGTGRWLDVQLSNPVLCIVVPLLALPQVTHYILDGFIWKVRKEEFK